MLHVYNDIFQHVNWTRAELFYQSSKYQDAVKFYVQYYCLIKRVEIRYTHFPKLPEENFL